MMLSSSAALCGALFAHYAASIFALALAIYAVVRLGSQPPRPAVILSWMAGQLGAAASVLFLYFRHVKLLKAEGMPRRLAVEWLSSSMFQPHSENLAWFVLKANIRFFRYLCWSSVFGGIAVLLFMIGIVWLELEHKPRSGNKPTSRQVGLMLGLPFLIICGTAVAGVYPYGSTRHSCILAGFAACGISVTLSRCLRKHKPATSAGIVGALLIGNLLPAPAGAYIRPRNQRKALMREAVSFLRHSMPQHSYILTDQEGGLLLSYYLCHSKVVQFDPRLDPLPKCECGDVSLITPWPSPFVFPPAGFAATLHDVAGANRIGAGQRIWFFQAGWIVDKEPALRAQLQEFGCEPHNFGQNMFACELSP